MTHLATVDITIRFDPDEHPPTRWPMANRPYRISGLVVKYHRDQAGAWINAVPGVMGEYLDDYTGPVDPDGDYALPGWAQQLVADYTPGTVTDEMVDAFSCAYEGRHTGEAPIRDGRIRDALAAALAVQVGEPDE